MEQAGAIVVRDGRLCAAAPHTDVDPDALRVPFPRDWPDLPSTTHHEQEDAT